MTVRAGDNNALSDLRIERDAVVVGRAALDVAVPVDPGVHRVVASAPGYEPWTTEVALDRPGQTHVVTIPKLTPVRDEAPDVPADTPVAWQLPVGITAAALGAVGMGVGIALGAAAKSQADDADCDGDNLCSPEGLTARDDAVSLGNAGTAVGIAGAVLAIAGVVVLVFAPSDEIDVGARGVRVSF